MNNLVFLSSYFLNPIFYCSMPGTDAVIAGGAIRDILLGKEELISDIDIFYRGTIDFSKLKSDFDFELNNQGNSEDLGYSFTGGETLVIKTGSLKNKDLLEYSSYNIQLIKSDDLDKTVDMFNCNLSKCWLSVEGLWVSDSFLRGMTNKYFIYSPETTHAYVTKMKQKYPEYIHVKPASFDADF